MSKYYTPTIEEFHVGFEYEFLSFQDETWRKATVTVRDESVYAEHFTFIDTENHIDRRRVKYLDREDIESLGFTWQSEGNGRMEFNLMGEFNTYLTLIGKEVNIQVRYEGGLVKDIDSLTIKNKSELRKVLSMLGIEK
jgi:hypothetical protein